MSWRKFFHRSQWDAERVQEIESHIAQEIDDNIARGMTPQEARRQAYLKFGNPQQVREEIWRMNSIGPLENILRDVRYGWRTLLRNPGYAILAVLTLGLGIGANTAIFIVINGVLLRPLPFPQPDRIVKIYESVPGYSQMELSPGNFRDWKARSGSFESFGMYNTWSVNWSGAGEPRLS